MDCIVALTACANRSDDVKLKEGFVYRQIAGGHVVIPIGNNIADFNGVITLNDTAAFLWQQLQGGAQGDELVSSLRLEYEVGEEEAREDVAEFLALLKERKVLAEE